MYDPSTDETTSTTGITVTLSSSQVMTGYAPNLSSSTASASTSTANTPTAAESTTLKAAHEYDDYNDDFLCQSSLTIMIQPVVIKSGQTYSRDTVETWFGLGHETDPGTNEPLAETTFVDNVLVKKFIGNFLNRHPHLWYTEDVELPSAYINQIITAMNNGDLSQIKRMVELHPGLLTRSFGRVPTGRVNEETVMDAATGEPKVTKTVEYIDYGKKNLLAFACESENRSIFEWVAAEFTKINQQFSLYPADFIVRYLEDEMKAALIENGPSSISPLRINFLLRLDNTLMKSAWASLSDEMTQAIINKDLTKVQALVASYPSLRTITYTVAHDTMSLAELAYHYEATDILQWTADYPTQAESTELTPSTSNSNEDTSNIADQPTQAESTPSTSNSNEDTYDATSDLRRLVELGIPLDSALSLLDSAVSYSDLRRLLKLGIPLDSALSLLDSAVSCSSAPTEPLHIANATPQTTSSSSSNTGEFRSHISTGRNNDFQYIVPSLSSGFEEWSSNSSQDSDGEEWEIPYRSHALHDPTPIYIPTPTPSLGGIPSALPTPQPPSSVLMEDLRVQAWELLSTLRNEENRMLEHYHVLAPEKQEIYNDQRALLREISRPESAPQTLQETILEIQARQQARTAPILEKQHEQYAQLERTREQKARFVVAKSDRQILIEEMQQRNAESLSRPIVGCSTDLYITDVTYANWYEQNVKNRVVAYCDTADELREFLPYVPERHLDDLLKRKRALISSPTDFARTLECIPPEHSRRYQIVQFALLKHLLANSKQDYIASVLPSTPTIGNIIDALSELNRYTVFDYLCHLPCKSYRLLCLSGTSWTQYNNGYNHIVTPLTMARELLEIAKLQALSEQVLYLNSIKAFLVLRQDTITTCGELDQFISMSIIDMNNTAAHASSSSRMSSSRHRLLAAPAGTASSSTEVVPDIPLAHYFSLPIEQAAASTATSSSSIFTKWMSSTPVCRRDRLITIIKVLIQERDSSARLNADRTLVGSITQELRELEQCLNDDRSLHNPSLTPLFVTAQQVWDNRSRIIDASLRERVTAFVMKTIALFQEGDPGLFGSSCINPDNCAQYLDRLIQIDKQPRDMAISDMRTTCS